jgi:hypothetical protein
MMEFVNGMDAIPDMKWKNIGQIKAMFQTTKQFYRPIGSGN